MSTRPSFSQPDLFNAAEASPPEAVSSSEPAGLGVAQTPAWPKTDTVTQAVPVPIAQAAAPDGAGLSEAAERYLSDVDVAVRYGISRATVWRWCKSIADFPRPIQISPGTTRWALSQLLSYERKLPQQARLGLRQRNLRVKRGAGQ